jgi:hypothetical protein
MKCFQTHSASETPSIPYMNSRQHKTLLRLLYQYTQTLPQAQHERIWSNYRKLHFPASYVYGVSVLEAAQVDIGTELNDAAHVDACNGPRTHADNRVIESAMSRKIGDDTISADELKDVYSGYVKAVIDQLPLEAIDMIAQLVDTFLLMPSIMPVKA